MGVEEFADDGASVAEKALMCVVGEMVDHIEYVLCEHALVHAVVAGEVKEQTESELLEEVFVMEVDLGDEVVEELEKSALLENEVVFDSLAEEVEGEEGEHVDVLVLEEETRLAHAHDHLEHVLGLFLSEYDEVDEEFDELAGGDQVDVLVGEARPDNLRQTLVLRQLPHVPLVLREQGEALASQSLLKEVILADEVE